MNDEQDVVHHVDDALYLSLTSLRQDLRGRQASPSMRASHFRPLEDSSSFKLSRRSFILAVTSAPLFLPVPAWAGLAFVRSSEISFIRSAKRVIVSTATGETWTIDPDAFDGSPRITFKKTPYQVDLALNGAFFPGTNISADFVCQMKRSGRAWNMSIQMSAFAFHAAGDLSNWLTGKPLAGFTAFSQHILPLGARTAAVIEGSRGLQMEFTPNWTLRLVGQDIFQARFDARRLSANQLAITVLGAQHPSILAQSLKRRTGFVFHRDETSWDTDQLMPVGEGLSFEQDGEAFGTATLEIGWSGQTYAALLFQSEPKELPARISAVFPLSKEETPLRVNLRQPRLAVSLLPMRGERALVADYEHEISWLTTGGATFGIGHRDGAEPFEAVSRDGMYKRVQCVPPVLETAMVMTGAVTTPAARPDHTRLNIQIAKTPCPDLECKDSYIACPPCHSQSQMSIRDFAVEVHRPKDLLSLHFEFENLELKTGFFRFNKGTLKKVDMTCPAYVFVTFPPQHVGEEAILDQGQDACFGTSPITGLPLQTRLSKETRLVFRLPDTVDRIPYTLDALLDWRGWILTTIPMARDEGDIKPPTHKQTAIEMPYRLTLTPQEGSWWSHSRAPVTQNQTTELWHTRLQVPNPHKQYLVFGDTAPRVSAAWSPDLNRLDCRANRNDCQVSNPAGKPFRMSLDCRDRSDIVQLSHNTEYGATTSENWESTGGNAAVRADFLALSALGGWLDAEGHWPKSALNGTFSLEKWEHRITMGRDQNTVIQRRGFLFPFGHRAVLAKETKRKIKTYDGRYVAPLIQRFFIIVQEPVRLFEDKPDHVKMPLRQVEFVTIRTPTLSNGNGCQTHFFWPEVCDEVFEFNMSAIDWSGNTSTFTAPVIFVEDNDLANDPPVLKQVLQEYTKIENEPRRIRTFRGQRVAIGRSYSKGDTEVDAVNVRFSANLYIGRNRCEVSWSPESVWCPPFDPFVDQLEARIPTLQKMLPPSPAKLSANPAAAKGEKQNGEESAGAAWFTLRDPDVKGNAAHIYAEVLESDLGKIGAPYHTSSDRSGGFTAPTPQIKALSRLHGPCSSASPAKLGALANGGFNPGDFFDPSANVLGFILLKDIIGKLPPRGKETPGLNSTFIPSGERFDETRIELGWETDKIQDWEPVFLAKNASKPAKLIIRGGVQIIHDQEDTSRFYMDGGLYDFGIKMVFSGNGIILNFRHAKFVMRQSEKTKVKVKIASVKFKGAIMEFVNNLKNQLGFLSGDKKKAFDINLTASGLVLSLPPFKLPTLTVGVFSLQNLNIINRFVLSFEKRPVALIFGLSRRSDPFLVSIGIFGGGGFFEIEVDTESIWRLEAAIEFGAFKELNLGIAHGAAYVLGGVYYGYKLIKNEDHKPGQDPRTRIKRDESQVTFIAYVRASGAVKALWIFTVSVDFYVALNVRQQGPRRWVWGVVRCSFCVKVFLAKRSFTLVYVKQFEGSQLSGEDSESGASVRTLGVSQIMDAQGSEVHATPLQDNGENRDRKFTEYIDEEDWVEFVEAFA